MSSNNHVGFFVGYFNPICDYIARSKLPETHRNISPRCLMLPGGDKFPIRYTRFYYNPTTDSCIEKEVNMGSLCNGFANSDLCQSTCTPDLQQRDFPRKEKWSLTSFQELYTCSVPSFKQNCEVEDTENGIQCHCYIQANSTQYELFPTFKYSRDPAFS